ncbi:MAG: cation transporter [Sphingomonas sp.]|uniref:cation diffusion facilitator family transporter n=1 Tax=Sphingomonas sp. TaxID=28214 RepID=UPI001AD3A0BE|nr:cation diffusion facilitator family transporter [Sphingomonas sp.]MBN8809153.1 cation transporter [Sphingomonas sp.]
MTGVREWLGFGGEQAFGHAGHGHDHGGAGGHGHTHGVIDPSLTTTDRGIWAIKWSFVILAITAALQFVVVILSGSVALLADMIHNVGDATTAIPLWFAFVLARRKPSRTFTYGLGRVEDLAGILIVLIILFSAIVAGYQAVSRLIHPQAVTHLGWLAAAGVIGFVGNEVVAVFRIRVGRQMNSAALIADGYHARTDGLTSLAVVLGAAGVWFGYPLADPIIGLLITIAILGIVWQSARAVITRTLDGVEPGITAEIRHAAEHVPGIVEVLDARARWMGHRLHADVAIAVDDASLMSEGVEISRRLKAELLEHIPALRSANVTFDASDLFVPASEPAGGSGHHHAPAPFRFSGELAQGVLEIVDTPEGERMRVTFTRASREIVAEVVIDRPGGEYETLHLVQTNRSRVFESTVAPKEPHEFQAVLELAEGGRAEALPFAMTEPAGHAH